MELRRSARGLRPVMAACLGLMLALLGMGLQTQPGGGSRSGGGSQTIPAARKATNVAVLTIKGEIQSITARSVIRRIKIAERGGADCIVIDLDTPGGEVGAVLDICNAIKGSSIANSVAWINPNAYSGGAIIALACREIVVNEPSKTGDALPIQIDMLRQLRTLPANERAKVTQPLLYEVVTSARQRGYDEMLVQAFVSLDVELWLVEHTTTGERLCINREEYIRLFGEEPSRERARFPSAPRSEQAETPQPSSEAPAEGPAAAPGASGPDENRIVPAAPSLEAAAAGDQGTPEVASNRPRLSERDRGKYRLIEYVIDGNAPLLMNSTDMKELGFASATIRNDAELQSFLGAKHLRRLDQSWSETLVIPLTMFPVRMMLVVVFIVAMFLESAHPGAIIPGSIAAVALTALLAPAILIGMASWWEVAAVIAGIILLVMELLVIPGFGIAGILGLLLLVAGLVGTFAPQGADGLFPDTPRGRSELARGFGGIMLSLFVSGVTIYFLSRHFGSLPILNKLIIKDPESVELPGEGMLAAMNPDPHGPVKVGAEGVAISPLRPAGRVQIGDQVIDAVAEIGYIPSGQRVKIVSATPFRVGVEAVGGIEA